jgi:hypothetical protein
MKIFKTVILAISVSKSSVHRATKLLRLKPYNFTVVQELQEADCVARVHFYNWFCEAVV